MAREIPEAVRAVAGLAATVLDEARGAGFGVVTLNVRPGEHSALGFWESLGFEDTGVIEGGQMLLRLPLGEPS